MVAMYSSGQLARLLITGQKQRDTFDPAHSYDYDVVVIGGGSGGLACSKVREEGREGEWGKGWEGGRRRKDESLF